jgi:hypothetical protein
MKRVVLCLASATSFLQAVDFRRQRGRQRRTRYVAGFGDLARRARCVGGDHGLDAERPDDVAALPERVHMAFDRPDGLQRRAFRRHQLMLHRKKPLGHDMQPRARHQMMDVSDPPGHRIVDRDHGERGTSVAHRGEGVLEGRTRQRLVGWVGLPAGNVRVRARFALESDLAPFACPFRHESPSDASFYQYALWIRAATFDQNPSCREASSFMISSAPPPIA